MEKDKARPNSQPPSPLPALLGAQASSEQQQEAERGWVLEKGVLAGELELPQRDHGEEAELSPEERKKDQDVTPGAGCSEQELSPGDARSYQKVSRWEEGGEQELSEDDSDIWEDCFDYWVASREQEEWSKGELSLGEALSVHEVSDWEEGTEQELFQGQCGSSPRVSDWEEASQEELSPPEASSYQEHSDWEESAGQELCEEQGSIGQDLSKGSRGKSSSMQSGCQDSGDRELAQDGWGDAGDQLHGSLEWDNVSLLELQEEEEADARQQRLALMTAGGRPVPFPREAWVEQLSPGPCPRVPLWATVALQEARATAASPSLAQQVPEAWPESPGPAQPGAQALSQQPLPRKKRPSRFRRALRALRRALVCFPCLGAPPED